MLLVCLSSSVCRILDASSFDDKLLPGFLTFYYVCMEIISNSDRFLLCSSVNTLNDCPPKVQIPGCSWYRSLRLPLPPDCYIVCMCVCSYWGSGNQTNCCSNILLSPISSLQILNCQISINIAYSIASSISLQFQLC